MFKTQLEKLTTDQLKKRNRLFLGIGILLLAIMIVALGLSFYQISKGEDGTWTALFVPIILCPLSMIPLMASAAVSAELKKRTKAS